jgi:aminopeptidase N
VNVDGKKTLLVEKKDNKTLENFIHQYKYAGQYLDRREAVEFASRNQDNPKAQELMALALKDKYYGLRSFAIGKLDLKNETVKKQVEPILSEIALKDPKTTVRATALAVLAQYNDGKYKSLYTKSVNDSSYTVAGTSLDALFKLDSAAAVAEAKRLAKYPAKGKLVESMTTILVKSGDENGFDIIAKAFGDMPISQAKFNLLQPFCEFLGVVKDTKKVKAGVDMVIEFRDALAAYGLTPYVNNLLKGVINKKNAASGAATDKTSLKEQVDYINAKIEGGADKKGF